MSTRPDQRLTAAAQLVTNLAHRLPLVRLHIDAQVNAVAQLHAANYDGSGRGGDRTVLVDVDCPGNLNCQTPSCPEHEHGPHTHTCRIPGPHTHAEATVVTAVEDHAMQRIRLTDHLADLEKDSTALALIAARLLRECDQILGTRLVNTTPRCDTTGRDGAIEWADPTCTNYATRGPLCDRCSKREYRWRQRHNLPPRRDGVYAGDLDAATR